MNWFCKHFGHDFQPRYSYGPPQNVGKVQGISQGGLMRYLELHRQKDYHCDVCTRCGQTLTVERLP